MVVLPFEKRMLPVRKSMTFMKKSDPHETTRLASGENLTPLTCLLCDGSSRIIDAVFRHQRNTVNNILGLRLRMAQRNRRHAGLMGHNFMVPLLFESIHVSFAVGTSYSG